MAQLPPRREAKKGLPKKPEKKEHRALVQKNINVEVYARQRLILGQGDGNREVLMEEFLTRLQKAVFAEFGEDAVRITNAGCYYLVDGKVCRIEDFDPKTMNRKPGTMPPSWAAEGEEKKLAILFEREQYELANPPTNDLARQPPKLLTSAETDAVRASQRKMRKRLVK